MHMMVNHNQPVTTTLQFIECLSWRISDVNFKPKLMTTSGGQFERDLVIINHQTVPMSIHSALLAKDRSVGEFDDNLKKEPARLVKERLMTNLKFTTTRSR